MKTLGGEDEDDRGYDHDDDDNEDEEAEGETHYKTCQRQFNVIPLSLVKSLLLSVHVALRLSCQSHASTRIV